MGHLFWLRELIDRKVVSHVQWADTRDMSSDGHTKGSIDREMLLKAMKGIYAYQHETKIFPPPNPLVHRKEDSWLVTSS